MYTIQKIASLAGISTRTLRYYDQIGLLSPSSISNGGYRLYDQSAVNQLQQILLFRTMGFSLSDIKSIVSDPSFDIIQALKTQKQFLTNEQQRIQTLVATIEHTIQSVKGDIHMSDSDKFKGLKEETIRQNEEQYGEELRNKYSDDTIDQSNIRMRKMSKWQWNRAEELGKDILASLPIAMGEGPTSSAAMSLCTKHQEWIQLYWEDYSIDSHLALCKMYTEDERFKAYYDKAAPGAAEFLYDAMKHYLSQ